MKDLRVLCWIWIVASTTVILFWAPVSVTRQHSKSLPPATTIEWIGPFGEPATARSVTRSWIDFSRLIIAVLAANLLPAVLLWQNDQVVAWLNAQQRHQATSDQSINNEMLSTTRARREALTRRLLISCVICLLAICLILIGTLIYNQQSMPTASRESPADEWKEVRRAIPVTR